MLAIANMHSLLPLVPLRQGVVDVRSEAKFPHLLSDNILLIGDVAIDLCHNPRYSPSIWMFLVPGHCSVDRVFPIGGEGTYGLSYAQKRALFRNLWDWYRVREVGARQTS